MVGHVVVRAQPKLALGSRSRGVIGDCEDGGLFHVGKPIESLPSLSNSNTQQGNPQPVITSSSFAFKPVPTFRPGAPVDRNLEGTELVLRRRSGSLLFRNRLLSGRSLLCREHSG